MMSSTDFQDFFSGEDMLRVSIVSDFKNLIKDKFEDEYQPATFKLMVSDTVVATRQIEVKPRGNMRRKTCYFPPLKLNFPKEEAFLNQIHEFDKMKMVMDCKRGDMFDQWLLGEYYAYKVFNTITDYSFRVRLVELTMIDVNDKMKSLTGYAFMIESIEQLAERHNAIPIAHGVVKDQLTDLPQLANTYLFQYLLGNTDWSIPGRHNMTMIKSKDVALPAPYVIPYDFDYAGIINTSYAVPDSSLELKTVRERLYRGVCIDESQVKEAAERYKKAKEAIYNVYNSSPYLDQATRKNIISYLDDFFQTIEDEKRMKRQILDVCRQN
jgi:hypothetical protein